MGGNTNAGPTADIAPPPLISAEVDVVPTVGPSAVMMSFYPTAVRVFDKSCSLRDS